MEDTKNYSRGSSIAVLMRCPNCGHERNCKINKLFYGGGFSCPKCSDGIPYPEKFLFNCLEQILKKDFEKQLTKSKLNWCGNYKYDFHIDRLSCIIETHGEQHYTQREKGAWSALADVQENDAMKKQLALDNGIKEENYIVLDCRKSDLDHKKIAL